MDDRAKGLRRRIATYRRQLAEGVPSDMALVFLTEITKLENELARERQAKIENCRNPG
jgi:hypothetical protein